MAVGDDDGNRGAPRRGRAGAGSGRGGGGQWRHRRPRAAVPSAEITHGRQKNVLKQLKTITVKKKNFKGGGGEEPKGSLSGAETAARGLRGVLGWESRAVQSGCVVSDALPHRWVGSCQPPRFSPFLPPGSVGRGFLLLARRKGNTC